VQFLRATSPATVVAVDTSEHRRTVASELGAHHVLDGVSESTASEIRTLTGELGADAVLDFVGVDATISAGLAATRKWGAYGLVGAAGGTYRKPWYGTLPADADLFTFQGSTIADARDVVALAAAGRIKSFVDVFPLSRVREAYEAMEAGTLTGRAVVTPEG
jgi:alcohol dehydrogenase, propanol-preferring